MVAESIKVQLIVDETGQVIVALLTFFAGLGAKQQTKLLAIQICRYWSCLYKQSTELLHLHRSGDFSASSMSLNDSLHEDGFDSQFDNLSEPLTRGPAGARAPPYPPARDYTDNSTRYRDPVFAVLFVGHLAVVAFFAAAKGIPALAAGGIPEVEIDKSGAQQHDEADQPVPLVLGLSLMMVLGAFFSSLWIKILITHGESLIRWTLLSTVVWFVLCSVAAAFARSVVGSIMLLVSAGISYWYYRSIDSRIEFAGKVSEHCVHECTCG
jgi:hypothetical protein